jgi:formylglycine-generating enzyme required for sulfatase activity
MFETFISLLGTANTIHDSYNKISGIFRSKDNYHIEYLDRIATGIERLSDNILYAPNMETVKDITINRQRKIDNFREVKQSLEPVQRAVGSEILSSAIILTPDKMQIAMQKSPWEVLDDIRPVNLSNYPNNPDLIPIVFEHSSVQYVGWLRRGLLPMVFDCEYDELLVPKTQIQTPSSSNKKKPGDIFHDRLKDNSEGPEMVLIPAGTFRMGDITGNGYSYEQPVHEVSVESFAMGRYPITFAEYDYFCEQTSRWFKKRKKPDDRGWGRGNRPVINVSWHDAVAYTEWLSEQTGQQYRLSTEAEWEYAARAGTETDYWWGNDIDETKANYNMNLKKTSPVGYYEANQFGLYDTAGNVWEWTCSEFTDRYNGNEKECISKNSNKYRVLRGGSWDYYPGIVRTAGRYWGTPDYRFDDLGFRVVQAAAWT